MTTPAPVSRAARHPREPLTVDLGRGRLRAAGFEARFEPATPDALELAYLRLVRRMRDVHREPSFVLRSDDVRALAEALDRDPVTVLQRLGDLMGATVTQRRSMVTAFLAGALLIVVATGAVAVAGGDGPDTVTADQLGDGPDVVAATAPEGSDVLDPAPPPSAGTLPADEPADGAVTDAAEPDDAVPAAAPPAPPTEVPTTSPPDGRAADRPASDRPARAGDDVAPPSPAPDPDRAGPADGQPDEDVARPPVEGEADAWEWGRPRVDQPGATIDLPPDDEVDDPAGDGAAGDDPAGDGADGGDGAGEEG
jgi:hypothetical protein